MGLLSSILRNGSDNRLTWWCPGCDGPHSIQHGTGHGPRWTWNGDAAKPTFGPSVLVRYEGADAGHSGAPPAVCHSYVVDGAMQFLGDCTHSLAGRTVEIPPWSRPQWRDG